jgi:hypothetical protein
MTITFISSLIKVMSVGFIAYLDEFVIYIFEKRKILGNFFIINIYLLLII